MKYSTAKSVVKNYRRDGRVPKRPRDSHRGLPPGPKGVVVPETASSLTLLHEAQRGLVGLPQLVGVGSVCPNKPQSTLPDWFWMNVLATRSYSD